MTALAQSSRLLYKDQVLNDVADRANVAQFVSFAPGNPPEQRFSRLRGWTPNHRFRSPDEALRTLLGLSIEQSINVRSYLPDSPKAGEFIYGLKSVDEALAALTRLAGQGRFTIANETIDVNDGGVSGVSYGEVVEFSPGDTPRAVEKPGTVALPRRWATGVLETVYRFKPALDYPRSVRVEFSLHPLRRGVRHEHTVVWELERFAGVRLAPTVSWPCNFSRLIGDKAFGLLLADVVGLPVPRTTVFGRVVAPFSFGQSTGSAETWLRTCPREPVPGRYITTKGWRDPFEVMSSDDPNGLVLASILSQDSVDAKYSGALIEGMDGTPIVEGVAGHGDDFMVGRVRSTQLPKRVEASARRLHRRLRNALGPVRFEWVHDETQAWVVQLHKGATESTTSVIVPGEAGDYVPFDVQLGLAGLDALIQELAGTGKGIVLVGDVGVTSHFGDLLRRAHVPSKIKREGLPLPGSIAGAQATVG